MTQLVPTAPGALVHDDGTVVGLEDFDETDLKTPRLAFAHTEGKMVNTLTKVEYDEIEVVMLGGIKQRILWRPEVDEDAKALPWCRSYDHKLGLPNPETFPYDEAGIAAGTLETPCSACSLKEWTRDGKKNTPPRCSEQWVIPVMIPDADGVLSPAIFTCQKSSMKPATEYLGSFQARKLPLFTSRTKITLDLRKRGNVNYVVPIFAELDKTNTTDHPSFVTTFFALRTFVMTPRSQDDPEDEPAAPTPVVNEAAPVIDADAEPELNAVPAAAAPTAAPVEEEVPF